MKTKYIKNNKMNDATYILRRKVIDILYEARKYGIILPRINVRIGNPTKGHENVLGVGGRLNIWITEKANNRGPDYLFHVTLHELCHAVYNLDHDENCKLMASVINTPCTARESWAIFRKYSFNNFADTTKKATVAERNRLKKAFLSYLK